MGDAIYLLVIVTFFGVCAALARGCQRLAGGGSDPDGVEEEEQAEGGEEDLAEEGTWP